MPLTEKGHKILAAMKAEYGEQKGASIFYASANSGKIKGVHEGTDALYDCIHAATSSSLHDCKCREQSTTTDHEETEVTRRKRTIVLRFAADGEKWITIGKNKEGGGKGVHVKIEEGSGKIEKGPSSMEGKTVKQAGKQLSKEHGERKEQSARKEQSGGSKEHSESKEKSEPKEKHEEKMTSPWDLPKDVREKMSQAEFSDYVNKYSAHIKPELEERAKKEKEKLKNIAKTSSTIKTMEGYKNIAAEAKGLTNKKRRDKINAELEKVADNAKITSEQHASLNEYFGEMYSSINKFMRMGKEKYKEHVEKETSVKVKTDFSDLVKNIDDVVNNSKLKENVVLYRGVGADVVKDLKVGDTYSDKAFQSTSGDDKYASIDQRTFGAKFVIHAKKGSKAYVNKESVETEVVLPRNSKFKVRDIAEKDGVKYITVEYE